MQEARAIKWRVVTRKLVWKQAANAMQDRLKRAGLKPIAIVRREPVEMHAFDDARTYKTRGQARKAVRKWQKLKVEANIIRRDAGFGIGLGRFYLPAYAERMRQRLEKAGKAFTYEKRKVEIPIYRFTFAAVPRDKAQALWQKVQDLGVADPVLMNERQFLSTFSGAAIQD